MLSAAHCAVRLLDPGTGHWNLNDTNGRLGSGATSPWDLTDERFVDPGSNQTMVVLRHPKTGERRYVAER